VDAEGKIHAQSSPAQKVPSFLAELSAKVREISNLKGHPQDIEWAWADSKLWFLQVRPITSRTEKKSTIYVFDNSNIQESYCGVTTPLTFSFASLAYHKVYDELMKLMNMSPKEIEAAQWRHRHLLAYIHGRVYYNINSWYEGLQYLPHFGRRKEEMETMMGIEEPVDFIQNITLSKKEKLQRLGGMILLLAKTAYRFSQLPKMTQEFDQWFWHLYRSADLEKLSELNDFEILQKIARFQKDSLEKWGTPVLNDFRVMMLMGSVKRSLEKAKIQFDLKSLIYGTEMESTKPTVELQEIAQKVGQNPVVQKIVLEVRGDQALRQIESVDPQMAAKIRDYIWKYGDRVMGELKLETITMKQDSEQFLMMLRGFLAAGLDKKTQLFSGGERSKLQVGRRTKKQIDKLCAAIAGRELMRLHRTRSFGANRQMFLALGERWQAKGILTEARDIFFLTQDEIFDFGYGRGVTKSLSALVELRKSEQKIYEGQSVQSQMHFHFPVGQADQKTQVAAAVAAKTEGDTILGLGCSAGVVEGEVKWVTSPEDIADLSGKILLAERTDPGWTPLFAMVKGVIIERGSILSHSAVIAREMGIPAVVGVKNMTSRLQNGDKVRIDGSTGRISVLERLGNHPGKSGQQQSHQEY
jgi:pyruvate,water dikinase